jgi:hypothetical protein
MELFLFICLIKVQIGESISIHFHMLHYSYLDFEKFLFKVCGPWPGTYSEIYFWQISMHEIYKFRATLLSLVFNLISVQNIDRI